MYFLLNGCNISLPSLKDLYVCKHDKSLTSILLTNGVPLLVGFFHHHGENVVEQLLLLKAYCASQWVLEKIQ